MTRKQQQQNDFVKAFGKVLTKAEAAKEQSQQSFRMQMLQQQRYQTALQQWRIECKNVGEHNRRAERERDRAEAKAQRTGQEVDESKLMQYRDHPTPPTVPIMPSQPLQPRASPLQQESKTCP